MPFTADHIVYAEDLFLQCGSSRLFEDSVLCHMDNPPQALRLALSRLMHEAGQSAAFSIQHADGESPLILNLPYLLEKLAPLVWPLGIDRLTWLSAYWDRPGYFQYLDADVAQALLSLVNDWLLLASLQTPKLQAVKGLIDDEDTLDGVMGLLNENLELLP